MANQPPKRKSRRSFLREIMFGWLFVTVLPILYAIADYIYPKMKKELSLVDYSIAKISDIPVNSFKVFRIEKKPIIVMNSAGGQIHALSLICTHLGCIVAYTQEDQKFHCNCHGSVFDSNGKNVAGPAPLPLKPYRVRLTDTDILISET